METEGTPVLDSAPAPSASSTTQSDAEYFDNLVAKDSVPVEEPAETEDESSEEESTEVEAKPVETDTEKQEETSEDEEEFREPEPENLKRTFKAHPELRDAFYRDKAFTQVIGSVKEARTYKELLPTVEAAQAALTQAQAMVNLDYVYKTNPADVITRLATADPQSFEKMVEQIRPVLSSVNPRIYREMIAEPVFSDVLNNLYKQADSEMDADLVGAIDFIKARLGMDTRARRDAAAVPTDPRVRQQLEELNQLKAEREAEYRQSVQGFAIQADRAVVDSIEEEVDTVFAKLPQDGLPAGVKDVVKGQIVQEVWRALDANRYLTSIYNAQKFSGDTSQEHIEKIVEDRFNQAKPHISRVTAAMMKKLTRETVASSQRDLKNAQASSTRKEVGAGANVTTSTPPKKIDYRKVSSWDIINGNY